MISMKSALLGAGLALAASSGFAATITDTNDRGPTGQITIGSTSDPATPCGPYANCQLQTILTAESGGTINATTDQKNFALFSLAGFSVATTAPTLLIEVTSGAANQRFGMFYDADFNSSTTADRTLVQIFNGSATNGATALLAFNIPAQTVSVNGGAAVSFSNSGFGFYLTTGDTTWYSSDVMNNGNTQFVAYQNATLNRWYLGFEDAARNASCRNVSSDCDHNDMFVSLESIQGGRIPEPASLALLGLAMVGVAGIRRRRA